MAVPLRGVWGRSRRLAGSLSRLRPLEHLERVVESMPVRAPSSSAFAGARTGWREWTTAALDLLFPPLCPLCQGRLGEGRRDPLCVACWERLPRLGPPYCACCGRPFYTLEPDAGLSHVSAAGPSSAAGPGLCEPCHRQPPSFEYARAPTLYHGPVREVLHAFKFGRKTALARPLGDLLAEAALPRPTVDCLVPVPLHPAREAERGFNQSLLLARRLSKRWRVPVADGVLKRTRVTRTQAELSAEDRRANVRGAFVLRRPGAVAGAHVLLIDDIFTTGATASECCRALRAAGEASGVGVLTVARVP